MKKLLLLFVVVFVCGCAGIAPESFGVKSNALIHEESENRLLTEAEFMERVSQSADQIYEDMSAIRLAAIHYANDNNGNFPVGNAERVKLQLLDGGYLKGWPVVPPFAFSDPIITDYRYKARFDNLDGLGAHEPVINARDLKSEVCEEFARRYSDPYFKGSIYDFEANDSMYPKEATGKDVWLFAIRWEGASSDDYCDVLWVVQYNN